MTGNADAAHSAANDDAHPQGSLPEALIAGGIHLKSHRHGEHRAACPECAKSKRRPSDAALAVRIDDLGAMWLCHRCGWKGAVRPSPNGPSPGHRHPVEPAPPDPVIERKRELAQETYRQSEPITGGQPFAYLTECRGITVWDRDRVRWHPACPAKLDEDGTVLWRKGCIVCPVTHHATGCVTAIWCIQPVMVGKVPRWGLAPVKGHAARLFDAPGPQLVVAEGVEDALSAHILHGIPAWAALSAGNMVELILPPRFKEILILADKDEPDANGRRIGLDNAHKLARRLRAEGRHVLVRKPKALKDANDVLRALRAGGRVDG
jgi:putative DNA primase/helicase